MRLYNDLIQEYQLVYGDHTEHLISNNQEVIDSNLIEVAYSQKVVPPLIDDNWGCPSC